MPDEDPNLGSSNPSESENTETPTVTTETPSVVPEETGGESVETPEVHDETPINTVGQALEEFQKEINRVPGQTQPGTTAPVKKSRKMEGLTPDEAKWFHNMGGQAYDALYPMYLEYKKLKPEHETIQKQLEEAKGSSFYDNENAYMVTEEYRELAEASQRVNAESTYWQQQLASIRAGNNWAPLIRGQDGRIVVGEEQEATPEAESIVINALSKANMLSMNLGDKLSGYGEQFKQKHAGYKKMMESVRAEIFKGVDLSKIKPFVDKKLEMFPPYRRTMEVGMLAEALVVIDALSSVLSKQRGQNVTNGIKKRTASNNGPTADSLQTGSGNKSNTVGAYMDEMNRIMGRA